MALSNELLAQLSWTRRLAHRLAGNDSAGDDLLQEGWMAAVRSPPAPGVPVRGWFHTVFRNALLNRHRGETRRRVRDEASAPADSPESPEDVLTRLQMHEILVEAVGALPEPHRQTVLLRYFEELTSEQIGERMNVPSGTVRGRLKTAVEILRDALKTQLGGTKKVERWLGVFLGGGAAWRGSVAATSATVKWALGVAGVLVGLTVVITWRGESEVTIADAHNPIEQTPRRRNGETARTIGGKQSAAQAKKTESVSVVSNGTASPRVVDAAVPKEILIRAPATNETVERTFRAPKGHSSLNGIVRFTGKVPTAGTRGGIASRCGWESPISFR